MERAEVSNQENVDEQAFVGDGYEPHPWPAEKERRVNDVEKETEQLSLRAEYVIRHYLADHPDSELRLMVKEGVIDYDRAYRTLTQLARDPKTGVQRPDIMPYVLQYEMMLQREVGQPFTVGFYDLDDFKKINTELDHTGADKVLAKAADLISHSVRQKDVLQLGGEDVTRWGGEEFVVIYSNMSQDQARVPAERLREKFGTNLLGLRPNNAAVTLSGGIVEYDPARHKDWNDLLKDGSRMVQAAKTAGKNRITIEVPPAEAA